MSASALKSLFQVDSLSFCFLNLRWILHKYQSETRQRFSGGIRRVFGVPAFVSHHVMRKLIRISTLRGSLRAGPWGRLPLRQEER